MGQLGLIRSGEVSDYFVTITFEVRSHQGLVGDRIGVVGDVEALGLWRLKEALQLKAVQHTGKHPITAPQRDKQRCCYGIINCSDRFYAARQPHLIEPGIALLRARRPTISGALKTAIYIRIGLQGHVKSASAWHGVSGSFYRVHAPHSVHFNRAAASSDGVQRCVPCADGTMMWSGAVDVAITK